MLTPATRARRRAAGELRVAGRASGEGVGAGGGWTQTRRQQAETEAAGAAASALPPVSTLRSRQPQRGGLQGFLSRLKNGAVRTTTQPIVATSTRVKVVAVGSGSARGDDKRTSLLSDQDHNEDRA